LKIIPTGRGPIFVDDCDLLWLLGLSVHWYLGNGYARAWIDGEVKDMHILIANRHGLYGQIDHKNQNRADNQFTNLRTATTSQNMANVGLIQSNTSGFKGVTWHRRDQNGKPLSALAVILRI